MPRSRTPRTPASLARHAGRWASCWSRASSPSRRSRRSPRRVAATRPPEAPSVRPIDRRAAEAGPASARPTAYEAWVEHADDRIDFAPGGRVTVGFKPRAGDAWPVGGAGAAGPARRSSDRPGDGEAANGDGGPSDRPARRRRAPTNGDADPPAPTPARRVDAPVDAPSNRLALPARAVSLAEPAAEPAFDLAAASGLRRQVFGFLPYWEVNGASTQARLRRALDDRLLLGRRDRQGRPQEAGRRRHAARPAGAAGRARA